MQRPVHLNWILGTNLNTSVAEGTYSTPVD